MENIILIVHVLVAVGVITLIMLQQGKGAETGASFGSGASQTVFGSQGSASFLSRTTAILATVFFLTSIALGVLAVKKVDTFSDAGVPSVQVEQVAPKNDAPISAESASESDAPVIESQPVESEAVSNESTNAE
ncbi:preprotein translocase subunit SecG [Endozoicomonas sp. (ex Bugula neritina AB1)]|nr:preprotein translocase subunit SecG [Endozoicomonas sp. (ex Bugula neritina AB1)]